MWYLKKINPISACVNEAVFRGAWVPLSLPDQQIWQTISDWRLWKGYFKDGNCPLFLMFLFSIRHRKDFFIQQCMKQRKPWMYEILSECVLLTWAGNVKDLTLDSWSNCKEFSPEVRLRGKRKSLHLWSSVNVNSMYRKYLPKVSVLGCLSLPPYRDC